MRYKSNAFTDIQIFLFNENLNTKKYIYTR